MTSRRTALALVVLAVVAAACSSDDSTSIVEPPAAVETVAICNPLGALPYIERAPVTEIPALARRGIYPRELFVGLPGTRRAGIDYARVTDALAAVRAGRIARDEQTSAACRITINVAAGTLRATADSTSTDSTVERLPWVIDVPDVTVRGALRMPGDDVAVGNATVTTRVMPTPPLKTSPLAQPIFIVNAHPGDGEPVGDGARIEGFTLHSGHAAGDSTVGGHGVLGVRAKRMTIVGNEFLGNFSERIDLRAVSGEVLSNYMEGPNASCSICLGGPGEFKVQFNRLVGGGIEGMSIVSSVILPSPAIVEPLTIPGTSAKIRADVSNNVVTGLKRLPVGTAFRVGAMGLGSPNHAGSADVRFYGNTATGNTFGIIYEAAFPVAGGSLAGQITASMEDDDISGNCQANVYVSFGRHNVGLGLASNRPYLRNSTYSITTGYGMPAIGDIWYAHPPGLGNTFRYNGGEVPNGMKTAYDAAKKC